MTVDQASRDPRFVLCQMCNLDRPDDLASWLIIDRRTGIPVSDGRTILALTRDEARAELARRTSLSRPD